MTITEASIEQTGFEAIVPDRVAFRRAFGRLPTGVSVVSVMDGDVPIGATISAVCSLSLDPPLLLACIDKRARTHDTISRAGRFGVNVLSAEHAWLSDFCARPGTSKAINEACAHRELSASPVIERALVHFDCVLADLHDGGDHSIFVGRIEKVLLGPDSEPLVHHGGAYRKTEWLFSNAAARPGQAGLRVSELPAVIELWENTGNVEDWLEW